MNSGTPRIASTGKALAMLEAVLADRGQSSMVSLAKRLGEPPATAHRQVTTLAADGYLRPTAGGRYCAGPRLLNLLALVDIKQPAINVAPPILERLAKTTRAVVQLGTLENDMVTYRIKTGVSAHRLFTRVGMQLEAYCSAIGKALLAALPADERRAYLANGPFVALTQRTITDPVLLSRELDETSVRGHAIDDGEIADDLRCMAVPVLRPDGLAVAAISVSQSGPPFRCSDRMVLKGLCRAAEAIESAAFSASS